MNEIKSTPVICGFSGTLKSTIASLYFSDRRFLGTPTKAMYNFDRDYCSWNTKVNPMNVLAARLWGASQFTEPLIVERSIFDFIYYAMLYKIEDFEDERFIDIKGIEQYETSILGKVTYYVINNQAIEFIKSKVLGSDPNRSQVYSSIEGYLDLQEKYLSYITSHMAEYNYLTLTDELVNKIINAEEFNLPWELKFKSNL